MHGIGIARSKCYNIISLGSEISQSCLRRDWELKSVKDIIQDIKVNLLKSVLSFEATIVILHVGTSIMKFTYDFK